MKCNGKVEIYARVTGFFRPVDAWNPGKKKEFKERATYKLSDTHGTKERDEQAKSYQ